MTEWSWKFSSVHVVDKNNSENVVTEVSYLLTGTRGEGENITAHTIGGRLALGEPNDDSFKPFASLTETDLVAFVSGVTDVDAIKLYIEAQLDAASEIKQLPF
jgi:hypothetical protein